MTTLAALLKPRVLLLILLSLLVVGTGCRTKSGSREFIPGKGWVPN